MLPDVASRSRGTAAWARKKAGVGVDGHHLAVLLHGDVGEVVGRRDAGDAAQHVETAPPGHAGLDRTRQAAGVDQVGDVGRHRPAGLARCVLEGGGVDVDPEHPGALRRQLQRHRPTDA